MGAIRHVVMWQLSNPENRDNTIAEMRDRLEALVGVVPGLRSLNVGPGLFPDEGNWDVLLVSEHDSVEAFREYQTHPAHLDIGGWVSQQVSARAAVDVQLDAS